MAAVWGHTDLTSIRLSRGSAKKTLSEKKDLKTIFASKTSKWGLFDYVTGWIELAVDHHHKTGSSCAFVATNTLVQGQHIGNFWNRILTSGVRINFAVRSFKWSNLASDKAGVTVVCIGLGDYKSPSVVYDNNHATFVDNINAYLLPMRNIYVEESRQPLFGAAEMLKGNYYAKSEHLMLSPDQQSEFEKLGLHHERVRKFYGATETINGRPRSTLWFPENPTKSELKIADIKKRMCRGIEERQRSADCRKNGMLDRPHQYREMREPIESMIVVPVVSSENRDYLPADLLGDDAVISNKCFALYDAPLWNFALIVSRLHWIWIGTVCVRMRTDFSYSSTLGWNTFPIPLLTQTNKNDLVACAEHILLTREAHFPATIADLYALEKMPDDLRAAHDANDETLERIYIGRCFKNDTERLEHLFALYTKMTESQVA